MTFVELASAAADFGSWFPLDGPEDQPATPGRSRQLFGFRDIDNILRRGETGRGHLFDGIEDGFGNPQHFERQPCEMIAVAIAGVEFPNGSQKLTGLRAYGSSQDTRNEILKIIDNDEELFSEVLRIVLLGKPGNARAPRNLGVSNYARGPGNYGFCPVFASIDGQKFSFGAYETSGDGNYRVKIQFAIG
jgi:hypothetical protein